VVIPVVNLFIKTLDLQRMWWKPISIPL